MEPQEIVFCKGGGCTAKLGPGILARVLNNLPKTYDPNLLIGFDESGSICGISVISIGETPGLGTKVQNKDFLDKFKGISSEDYQVDNITGATYSSKGMKAAVNTALEAYSQMKGESENG